MPRKKKSAPVVEQADDGEYMVRWRRTKNQKWYYLPMVFTVRAHALERAALAAKSNEFYDLEVVSITPVQEWNLRESTRESKAEA